MKIRYRIFLGFAVTLTVMFYFLISWILGDVAVQPKKSMEETMLDTAQIIATYLERQMTDGAVRTTDLAAVMKEARHREFLANIYELRKSRISLSVYVTDQNGKVLYDSIFRRNAGKDFSRWNDVRRTLQGQYGARTTRENPLDPLSSVAYVSAPIRLQGRIAGVCTVGKSWESINSFIVTTRHRIITMGVVSILVILGLSYLVSFWITIPLQRLNAYARAVRDGRRVSMPRLGSGEVKNLGESFEEMRESLEGKTYVEDYIQTLTHQLKGPLSAIKGAAELLQEKLPPDDQARFIANIQVEGLRIQQIIDRLLELAAIEKRRELENTETIELKDLLQEVLESFSSAFYKKKIECRQHFCAGSAYRFMGERFLIRQALLNLLQNAVDFTPENGTIDIDIEHNEATGQLRLRITDSGPGIPEYAQKRIFEKFYSLQRPGSDRKGTGLGLTLVKEVTELHHGMISIGNGPEGGAVAVLTLPALHGAAA